MVPAPATDPVPKDGLVTRVREASRILPSSPATRHPAPSRFKGLSKESGRCLDFRLFPLRGPPGEVQD